MTRFDDVPDGVPDDGRDLDLAHALAGRRAPEHAPGFWTEMEQAMAAPSATVVVPLDQHRSRRAARSTRIGAVASVVAVAIGAVGLLTLRTDPSSIAAETSVTGPAGASPTSPPATTQPPASTLVPTTGVPTTVMATLPAPTTTSSPPPTEDAPLRYAGAQPAVDAVLFVVGVEHGSELSVHDEPDRSSRVLSTVPATGTMQAAGSAVISGDAMWLGVTDGGWVPAESVALPGLTRDLGSEIPYPDNSTTRLDAIETVIAGSEFFDRAERIVYAFDDGDATVIVDLLGVGDDSILGERLFVTVAGSPSSTGWSVVSVEAEYLCRRTVDNDGECR